MVFRMTRDPAGDERVLRAKYLDWCSARVADHFLRLSPDEIYELAHYQPDDGSGEPANTATLPLLEDRAEAAGSPLTSAALSHSEVGDAGAGYLALVRRAAEVLAARLQLPPFEEWVEAYERAPAPYDEELLGFWKGILAPTAAGRRSEE